MCGRFTRTSSRDVLAEEFGITTFVNVDLRPRYNIAPSQIVEAIIGNGAERRLGPMKWGFVSPSATESTLAPMNARAETVATTALFRDAFRRRRCLIVADGFYEWQANGPKKTPYFIPLRSGRPFGFAGIWSLHRTAVGTRNATCAILTCAPNELMAPIHNRMPVILPAAARERWLDASAREVDLRALLVPLASEEMEA
jgi:putative SOS response-associated peptidase YedK